MMCIANGLWQMNVAQCTCACVRNRYVCLLCYFFMFYAQSTFLITNSIHECNKARDSVMCVWIFIESISLHMFVWAGVDDDVHSEALIHPSLVFLPMHVICSVDDYAGETWRQKVFESESESEIDSKSENESESVSLSVSESERERSNEKGRE